MHEDFPEAHNKLSKGHDFDLSSNVFQRLPFIFLSEKPKDGNEYISILGLDKTKKRAYRYIRKEYIENYYSLGFYKVFLPQANGSGMLGETLSSPLVGRPFVGHTETFLSLGKYNDEIEANNTLKYLKCKFTRALLGIKKITQSNVSDKWECVPLQNFTLNSDINWSQSVHDIDQQLYKKYGLDDNEIEFIETKVKEMD